MDLPAVMLILSFNCCVLDPKGILLFSEQLSDLQKVIKTKDMEASAYFAALY